MMGGEEQSQKFLFCPQPRCGKIQPYISSRAVPLFTLLPQTPLDPNPPASRDNTSPGDKKSSEINHGNCWYSPHRRVPTGLPPDSGWGQMGGGHGRQVALPSPGLPSLGLCLHSGLVPGAAQGKQCLGYRSASVAEPDLGWDGCTILGCAVSTRSQNFAVQDII